MTECKKCEMHEMMQLNNEGNQGNLKIRVKSHFGGIQWLFTNSKEDTLSIILHNGSYGRENGLFEILPSWRKPTKGDDVKGFLTFGKVQKWINELSIIAEVEEIK